MSQCAENSDVSTQLLVGHLYQTLHPNSCKAQRNLGRMSGKNMRAGRQ